MSRRTPTRTNDWGDRPGDTLLSIKVPAADPLVRTNLPAHVTVLYPFLPLDRIDAPTHHALAALLAAHPRFRLTFSAFRRYPGVLYLAPEPAAPVRALTTALTAAWPDALPYRGLFGPTGLDPHLTLCNDPSADHTALEASLSPALPLTTTVDAVHLAVFDGTRFNDRITYRLGGHSS